MDCMDDHLNGKLDDKPLTRGNVRRRARGGGEKVPGEELPEHLVQHQLLVLAIQGDEPRQHLLEVVLCSVPSVPQPVVQSRRRPLLGPSPG